ncbi:HAD family hydrolase [Antribacter gilvus]|uniref:HAD family hydrolase n=1 Tax=Antribacter gilvus TaxID=2304675 RepID=UPI000F76676E|nr:HAD hydrolase family protein [Antribacter gilvus]
MLSDEQLVPARVRTAPPALVALDIDGTLFDRDMRLPIVTVDAVDRVRAAGHHVVLASGRSLVGILPVAAGLGILDGWVVASNGAVTARLSSTRPGGYALQDVRTFDVGPVVRLARAALPWVQVGVEVIGWGYRVSSLFGDDEVNGEQRVEPVEELGDVPVSRAILRGAGVLALLEPLRTLGVTATPAGPDWIDVTAVRLSKATALENVRRALGVDVSRTISVGDGVNDLEMIAWSARGVAMGHAPGVVRDAADEVTGTIAEHGVVAVLNSLL